MSPRLPSRHNPEWKSTEADVRAELDRILASREFAGADRLCRFLRFAVERTLAGDREGLKESVIGPEVFDREPGYDPKADPIVRTAALRLRAKLDEYYEQPGRWSTVRIAMPKGAYLARFEPRPQAIALPALAPVKTKPRIGGGRWVILATGLAALAAAACLVFFLRPPPSGGQPVQATVTSYPGHQQQPALSPDGSQVAFVWEGESGNNRDIYVTMASGGSPRRRITTDPGADDFPAWSPDGSTIAFVRENRSLMLVTPLGTNERRVTSAYDSKLSWSPDGRRIVFADWLPNGGPLAVFAADVATGERRQVTAPGQFRPGDVIAEISPNGQEVAFARSAVGVSTVYRIPIGGGEPRLVCRPGLPAEPQRNYRSHLGEGRAQHRVFRRAGRRFADLVGAGYGGPCTACAAYQRR
ncbi:hypothetical protein SBA3_3000035 [Candidatus Sulfopaludibacter sp. SbA3]|nr:hypothetical protein SBA3_3000035 [Candidatus Sulfopaludibacter sp. SbA3]